ncbi:HSP20-like chaperone [Sesbania bispinosa]|nr:HSP20-like chaperone [Sesbania bispinosa]
MEVELGLKITTTRDDTISISDFQFAKDRAGPVFLSKETDSMFTLTAHLKGYKKENIDININKDGTKISVSGEKEVQEMQMIPFKKELKTKGFRKKFKIPDGVGVGIEEVKEEEVVNSMTPEPEQSAPEKVADHKTEEETAPVKKRGPKKPWKKPCPPLLLGGSTLLVSLIFL